MKRFLFINPKFYVRHPPLGIAYLASYINKYYPGKYRFCLVDYAFQSDKDLLNTVHSFRPDIAGITATTNTFFESNRVCSVIKHVSNIPVLIGGVHITAVPDDLIGSNFDLAVLGEGEETFHELLRSFYETGKLFEKQIKGIAYCEEGKLFKSDRRPLIKDLDTIPMPDYSILNMDFYTKPRALAHGFYAKGFSMIPSRGCPYGDCSFCSSSILWEKKVRTFSAERVYDEMKYLINNHNLNSIIFLDDNFTTSKKWLESLATYIKKSNFADYFKFDCESIAEFIDDDKAKLLKTMGCERIEFGFESGSQRVLNKIKNKRAKVSKNSNAIQVCNRNNIKILGNFIYGWFDETLEELNETIDFIHNHKIDFVALHTLAAYPGTHIWNIFLDLYRKTTSDKIDKKKVYTFSTHNNTISFNDNLKEDEFKGFFNSQIDIMKKNNLFILHELGINNTEKYRLRSSFLHDISSMGLDKNKVNHFFTKKDMSSENGIDKEIGILFDSNYVNIFASSKYVGGSWQGKPYNGMPTAWDMDTIRFFHEQSLEYKHPFMLDIGANTGTFCLLPKINPDIKGIAFEPTPDIYEILKKNILLNNIQNKMKTMPIALSDKKGVATLKYPRSGKDSGFACLGKPLRFNDWIEVEVPTDTLDNIALQQKIEKVDLIKIDTEGCELFVLKGGEGLIREYYPGILAEFYEQNTLQFGYHADQIKDLLFSWGYSCKQISKEDVYFYKPKKTVHPFSLTNKEMFESDKKDEFRDLIFKFALANNRIYYQDQTPESLNALVSFVNHYKPTIIIELGTLTGLSLRTWLSTGTDAKIIAIDISFKPLYESQKVVPIDLSRVKLLEQNALQTDFSKLWSAEDKVLFYFDAHDQPNVPIMKHFLNNAIPCLPKGSIVIVDDLWYSSDRLTNENVRQFFENTVLSEIDPLQCFEGYYAPYWKGGSFFGFLEVIPFLEWVNRNQIELIFDSKLKMVAFELPNPLT